MPTFRNALYTGVVAAVVLGIYLAQLWTPERQVELHIRNFLEAIEESDARALGGFLADTYQDEWGHDKAVVLSRLKQVVPYARNGRLVPREEVVRISGNKGEWQARIAIEAEANELTAPLIGYVNGVTEPWRLHWTRQSWKPWDWKLVRVSNPGFEIPRQFG